MKTLEGRITITRTRGNVMSGTPVSICLRDHASGCNLVELRMSLEGFAEVLLGRGECDCVYEYYEGCPVGKVREVKTVPIPCGRRYGLTSEQIDAMLAPHEVDGWEGRGSDFKNGHCYSGDVCNVTFMRWVDEPSVEVGDD